MIYENLSNHQTHSRNPGKNNEILKWRKYLSSNVNTTRQSLDSDKEKKRLFAFISTSFLFTRTSAAVNVFMFVRSSSSPAAVCEEPGGVHGSPLAAVLHCVVEAASLNRVYLREGGREEGVRGEMQLAAAAF